MIRKFRTEDLDAVLNLWLAANLQAHPFIDQEYWSSHYDQVREGILQADVSVYEEAGQVLGFLGMQENYIAGLFVAESARSQGIGPALLGEAKKAHKRLELSVYEKNCRAVQFYLREGFQISGRKKEQDTGEIELHMSWGAVTKMEPVQ